VTNCIAWPSRCHDMIHDIYDGPCDPLQLDSICISSLSFADDLIIFSDSHPHETNNVILYIHSVHKHRGNSFQRKHYKMRLKQRSLNWINSMQVKKILFTNVFFSWSLCLLNMFRSMVFPKHFYFSGLLT
jgi:hypothetical protein